MSEFLSGLWRVLTGGEDRTRERPTTQAEPSSRTITKPLDIAPNDPLLPLFQSSSGVVDITKLEMDSPALGDMKEGGVSLAIPLVSQGELIGLLNLGPRLSEQDYSADDRALLSNLATQAAPALRVAQLVRQQKEEARALERFEQELRIARLIQQTLLPKELPDLPGWQVGAYYQPAREVGGDFYDFMDLPDGQLGIIVADVTDKGVPAALVMATTRSTLRATAERIVSPGEVLKSVNEKLCLEIPENMFVTCLYAVLNPEDGRLTFANAGHDLPYVRRADSVDELYATGMPLGLMPGMEYEERETQIHPGDTVLFHSDGLAEAHNPKREMFGFPRMKEKMAGHPGGTALIDFFIDELSQFTGENWEQEDDVTLVTLEHTNPGANPSSSSAVEISSGAKLLTEFSLPSEVGIEREAIRKLADAIQAEGLNPKRLERLKTAVGEATMNAVEHGNQYSSELEVRVRVMFSNQTITVQIIDSGGGDPMQVPDESPDLEAKLKGEQSPRGWGLFLIKNMVDEMKTYADEGTHTIELMMNIEGDDDGDG